MNDNLPFMNFVVDLEKSIFESYQAGRLPLWRYTFLMNLVVKPLCFSYRIERAGLRFSRTLFIAASHTLVYGLSLGALAGFLTYVAGGDSEFAETSVYAEGLAFFSYYTMLSLPNKKLDDLELQIKSHSFEFSVFLALSLTALIPFFFILWQHTVDRYLTHLMTNDISTKEILTVAGCVAWSLTSRGLLRVHFGIPKVRDLDVHHQIHDRYQDLRIASPIQWSSRACSLVLTTLLVSCILCGRFIIRICMLLGSSLMGRKLSPDLSGYEAATWWLRFARKLTMPSKLFYGKEAPDLSGDNA